MSREPTLRQDGSPIRLFRNVPETQTQRPDRSALWAKSRWQAPLGRYSDGLWPEPWLASDSTSFSPAKAIAEVGDRSHSAGRTNRKLSASYLISPVIPSQRIVLIIILAKRSEVGVPNRSIAVLRLGPGV